MLCMAGAAMPSAAPSWCAEQHDSRLPVHTRSHPQQPCHAVTAMLSLLQGGCKPLKSLVDLGSEVYCQAQVQDTSSVYISIGLGFHLECSLDEAPRVIELRRAVARAKLEDATTQSAKIRAHIKLVEGGLMELMNLKGA